MHWDAHILKMVYLTLVADREGSPPLVRAHKVTTCHRWRVSRSKLRYKDRVQCGLASLIYFWNGLVSFGRGNLDRTRAPSVYHT